MKTPRTAQTHAPSGFFALRTPLLPFDDIERWSGSSDPTAALREILSQPEMREAIFVASPEAHAGYLAWDADPSSGRGLGAERALVAYFTRAAFRPTPFGLFAGGSIGTIGSDTRIALEERERYARHSRLDMDFLWSLADAVAHDREARETLRFRPNSSLYRAGGRLRFAEGRLEGGRRAYRLVGAGETSHVRAALDRARPGATLAEIADALDAPREEAVAFVHRLADAQLLVPDVYPNVTGDEPVHRLVANVGGRIASALTKAGEVLASIDACGIGVAVDRYGEVARALDALPIEPDPALLVQVDMTKPVHAATLGRAVVDDLSRAVDVLRRLTPSRAQRDIDRFRERFVERYEDREVPLVEALDAELGVGFEASADAPGAEASPLLAGLSFAVRAERRVRWEGRELLLLRKLVEAAQSGAKQVEVTTADVDRLEPAGLPDAFSVVASLASGRHGHRVVVDGAAGPSGVRLLGRFCHVDQAVAEAVARHVRAEEALAPHVVHAEVVHLPAGRVGNVLARPVLRGHEIAYLGESGAPQDRRLPVTDLMMSVQGGRVVLRSARLGREVVPRLTTAHTFAHGLGIYRFLGALQEQDSSGPLAFSWEPFGDLPFLPRVVAGAAVLAKARWNVATKALEDPVAWRDAHDVPRFVALVEGDNHLLVDFENEVSVRTLVRFARRAPVCTLVEMLPAPDDLAVTGPEGHFTNEIVVPFVRTAPREEPPATRARTPSAARTFVPGSEWLYLKLYCGKAGADTVLHAIAPQARRLARSWFFLRYGDPDWHLRVRLHHPHDAAIAALAAATSPLVEQGIVHRVQYDTYEREVERYGGPHGVEIAERIFHADSEAVTEILSTAGVSADVRWRVALGGIDALLDDFGYDLAGKEAFARRFRDALSREQSADAVLKTQIGERFAAERARLEALMAGTLVLPGAHVLATRSDATRPLAREITSDDDIVWSFAHLFVNRLLRASQRAQELVLYDFLSRLYHSQRARNTP